MSSSMDVSELLFAKKSKKQQNTTTTTTTTTISATTTPSTNESKTDLLPQSKKDEFLNNTTLLASMLSSDSDDDDDNDKKKKNNKKKANKKKKKTTTNTTQNGENKQQNDISIDSKDITNKTDDDELVAELKLKQQQKMLELLKHRLTQEKKIVTEQINTSKTQSEAAQHEASEKLKEATRQRNAKHASKTISRFMKKADSRISLEALRSVTAAFDLVELEDTTAPDPLFLVYVKAYFGNLQVSRHWSQKRRLYANNTGNQKTTFVLPQCIEDLNARQLVLQQTAGGKSLTQELSAIAKAKVGRHNIDYDQWYTAFHIHMPNPQYPRAEDVFYEGKLESEQFHHLNPMDPLSPALQHALGMMSVSHPTPASTAAVMPPWIPAMQRYGPPPSYAGSVYIPGVNAPLPPGATWDVIEPNSQSSTHWGVQPLESVIDPITGQQSFREKWDGDLFGTSAYMQSIQSKINLLFFQDILNEKTKTDNNNNNDGESVQYKSITGAWIPRPRVAAPPTAQVMGDKVGLHQATITCPPPVGSTQQPPAASSLYLPQWTPIVERKIINKLYKNQDVAQKVENRVVPLIFGAVDYLSQDLEIKLQLEAAMHAQDEDMDDKYSSTTIGAQVDDEVVIGQQQQQRSTYAQQQQQQNQQQQQQQQQKSEDAARWKEEQRQRLVQSSIAGNMQHLAQGGRQQQQEVQIQSSYYGSTNGQLYREIPQDDGNNPNAVKRKQMGGGDDGNTDYTEHMNKRQRY